jgi:hypothetical protein
MINSTIHSLYLLPAHPQPPQTTQKAFKGLSAKLQGSAVPWHLTMPEKAYKSFQRDIEIYNQAQSNLDLSYYNNIFVPTEKLFEYIKPAKINVKRYQEYAQIDQTGHIQSFKPDSQGYAQTVQYSRINNITGRFKTISGPMLLHLPKIYRSVLESRWGTNGAVISLDYKSLEPRVLLATCGTQPIERDIYESVRASLFQDNPKVTRDVVKGIVLSEIYGAGIDSLRQRLPNIQDLEAITEQISDWFKLESLRSKLYEQWKETDYKYIINFYGRRVKTDTAHTLINHYVQSTAVDVAVLGFLEILQYIEEIDKQSEIIPTFILHDALILDVHENCFNLINGLCKLGGVNIKNLESTMFYMSADTRFSK